MDPDAADLQPPRPSGSSAGTVERTFTAQLWLWDARRQDTWVFVSLPADISTEIEDEADGRGPRAGFGSVKVHVRIASTAWSTSVFPDRATGRFVLPIKRSVRRATGLEAGDLVTVHLRTA